MDATPEQPETQPTRPRPSRRWYVLSALLLIVSVTVFAATLAQKARYLVQRIEPMPRFVGPTGDAGALVTIDQPGKQNIYYENRGTFDGKLFNTHRRQVWTTYAAPSMVCEITRVDSGETVEVRLPGVNDADSPSRIAEDQIINYDIAGMQGHGVWVFDADEPGDFRIAVRYVDAVGMDPASITIPEELTKAQKKTMNSAEGAEQEAARRDAIERAQLALLEPVDVLFAVGPDPTRGSFFQVVGLKGAAAVLAFGFTASTLIALVTFMLRNGHVTPRGTLADVRRGFTPSEPR